MAEGADPLLGLDRVPWADLPVAYGEGYRVPGILRRLASAAPIDVDRGWEELNEQIIYHQGTVYPGTAAAVPFLAQLASKHDCLRRPRLVSYLALLSLGRDEPYSPAGTASQVRDAVRSSLETLKPILNTSDRALGLAAAELAAALPYELPEARPLARHLFANEGDRDLRKMLAGACAMLGERSTSVLDELREVERGSVARGYRLPGGLIALPSLTELEHPRYPVEDIVTNPVHTKIDDWVRHGAFGLEDERFLDAARAVSTLCGSNAIWLAP